MISGQTGEFLCFTVILIVAIVSLSFDELVQQNFSSLQSSLAVQTKKSKSTTNHSLQDSELDISTLISMERGRLCPELMAATRFMVMHKNLPKLRMAMIQLVGQWEDENQGSLMMQAFEHNRKVCEDILNIPSSPILEPPKEFNNTNDTSSPAFWKMLAVKEKCVAGDSDVVLFLDGDVIITDPSMPVEALWHFYAHFNPTMDILFGVDINSINSGIFLVNCRSPTAIEFLEEWHDRAPELSIYNPLSYEQTFLQYVLEVSSYWLNFVPKTKPYRNHPIPRWDNYSQKAIQFPEIWSTKSLRQRLQQSATQCVFSGYPIIDNRARKKGFRTFQPGDVMVHMAGMKTRHKLGYTLEYLNVTAGWANSTPSFESGTAVAMAYLLSHLK